MRPCEEKRRFKKVLALLLAIALALPLLIYFVYVHSFGPSVALRYLTLYFLLFTVMFTPSLIQFARFWIWEKCNPLDSAWAAIKSKGATGSKYALRLFALVIAGALLNQIFWLLSLVVEWRKLTTTDVLLAALTAVLALVEVSRWRRETMPPVVEVDLDYSGSAITGTLILINNSSWGYVVRAYVLFPHRPAVEGRLSLGGKRINRIILKPGDTAEVQMSFPIDAIPGSSGPVPGLLEVVLEKSRRKHVAEVFPFVIRESEIRILD